MQRIIYVIYGHFWQNIAGGDYIYSLPQIENTFYPSQKRSRIVSFTYTLILFKLTIFASAFFFLPVPQPAFCIAIFKVLFSASFSAISPVFYTIPSAITQTS